MKQNIKKSIKKLSEHEKNLNFAFHEFGFFGINQYRIMVFFWLYEITLLPGKIALAYFGINTSWLKAKYSFFQDHWTLSERTPTLEYVGLFTIVLALSHPFFIIEVLKRASFLNFKISRSLMEFNSIVYAIFIALLSSRLVDLLLDLAKIATMGSPARSIII